MKNRGFTLVEILVALALSGLLVMGLQAMLVGARRAERRLAARTAAGRSSAVLADWLHQDLENLTAGSQPQLQDNQLLLTTVNSLRSQRPTPRAAVNVRYRLVPVAQGELRLERSEWDFGTDAPPQGVPLGPELRASQWQVFDGRQWVQRWPPPTPRPGRALRWNWQISDGNSGQVIIPLAPLMWRPRDA